MSRSAIIAPDRMRGFVYYLDSMNPRASQYLRTYVCRRQEDVGFYVLRAVLHIIRIQPARGCSETAGTFLASSDEDDWDVQEKDVRMIRCVSGCIYGPSPTGKQFRDVPVDSFWYGSGVS